MKKTRLLSLILALAFCLALFPVSILAADQESDALAAVLEDAPEGRAQMDFKLDYEYGPMTLKTYYTGGALWHTNKISSFQFTKKSPLGSSRYSVSCSVQGYIDYDNLLIDVNLYDKNDRMIGNMRFAKYVQANASYNLLLSDGVECSVLDNTARIAFFSYSGHPAIMETPAEPEQPTPGKPEQPTPEKPTPGAPSASTPAQAASYLADIVAASGATTPAGYPVLTHTRTVAGSTLTAAVTYVKSAGTLTFAYETNNPAMGAKTDVFMDYDIAAARPTGSVEVNNYYTIGYSNYTLCCRSNSTVNPSTYAKGDSMGFYKYSGNYPTQSASQINSLCSAALGAAFNLWDDMLRTKVKMAFGNLGFSRFDSLSIDITPTTPDAGAYTITFKADGAEPAKTTMATGPDGKLSKLPAAPRKSGYTFKGWYTKSSGGSKISASKVFTKDTTVYAQWTKKYTITFKADGAAPPETKLTTKTTGKLSKLPAAPKKTGYKFKGWYTKASGGSKISTSKVFTKNTTVYAQWTKK